MADVALSTTIRVATLPVPERDCPKPDTYFDGTRWRCRACTWTSPREGGA